MITTSSGWPCKENQFHFGGSPSVTSHWEPLEASDLDRVDTIQRIIHADLPERLEFLDEKRSLFPDGCRKLLRGGAMVGYALAHPWTLGEVPVLNRPLGALPAHADCLHMHDVAILPEGRGAGAAGIYVGHLRGLANEMGIRTLACVSVYGTAPFWSRHGFDTPDWQPEPEALRSYGSGAVYMVLQPTA